MDSYDSLSDLPGDIVLQVRREATPDPDVFYFNVDLHCDLDNDDLALVYEVIYEVIKAELDGVEVFEA